MHGCFWRPILGEKKKKKESLESNELSICFKDLVKVWLNNPKLGWEEIIKKKLTQSGKVSLLCFSVSLSLSASFCLSLSSTHSLFQKHTHTHTHARILETFCPWLKGGNLQCLTYFPTLKLYKNRNAHTYSVKEILGTTWLNPPLLVLAD